MLKRKDIISSIKEDRLTINLMLTRQCNFRCGHCFYSCGPDSPKGYMSSDVYDAVLDQINVIGNLIEWPNITINLIGGEPTLNMKEFKVALQTVYEWLSDEIISGMEMTTNGWWLHSDKDTIDFFKVISEVIPEDFLGLDNGFSVRVSNDAWHDEFRPEWMKSKNGAMQTHDKLARTLSGAWDNSLLHGSVIRCQECDTEFETVLEDGDQCPIRGCDGWLNYEEYILTDYVIPNPDDGSNWIYVEKKSQGNDKVIPVGRGEGFGYNDKAALGDCHAKHGNYLTYKPDGTLGDICCSGSDFPAGSAFDDPIELLQMAKEFAETRETCYGCHEDARTWLEERKELL